METVKIEQTKYNTREQWNNLAEEYGLGVLAQRNILFPGIVSNYLPLISLGARVLDIGCGDGTYSHLISEARKGDVLGVDMSEEMIEKAKSLYCQIDFRVGTIENVDDIFDNIFANMLLCNIPKKDIKSFFERSRRLLSEGGSLAFTNVSPDFQKTCDTDYLVHRYPGFVTEGCTIDVELKTTSGGKIGPFKNYHYSSDYLINLAVESGFKVKNITDLSSVEENINSPKYRLFVFEAE